MTTVRISQAELERDLRAVLKNVQQGIEVIVEQEDHQPLAIISSPCCSGRPITDVLREAKQHNSDVTLDENFGTDLEEVITSHQQPWNPPSWE